MVSEHDVSDTEREKELILLPKPSVPEVGCGSVPTLGIRAGFCNLLLSPPAVAHRKQNSREPSCNRDLKRLFLHGIEALCVQWTVASL